MTRSFWMDQCQVPNRPKLEQDIETEIVIVGAGIVGLTCAYILSNYGKKVVVVDADTPQNSQTARTTGHLVNVLDDRYIDIERLHGEEGSFLAASSHTAAVSFIEQTCAKESIDCTFERVDAYLFAPKKDRHLIIEEVEAVKRAKIECELVDRCPLDFDTGIALKFYNQAQFYPLEYLSGLMNVIKGKIYFHTHIMKFDEKVDHVVLQTDEGYEIRAQKAIIATNTPVNNRVVIHTKQHAYRTYVFAAKIPKGSITKALYYDTLDPYHYVRLASSGDQEYIILGGQDHKTGQNAHPDACYERLQKWAQKRFKHLGKIEYMWSGQIYEPVDSLAFIGKNPFNSHTFIATGDSGNGLTHGTIAAILISDLIMNKKNPWEKLYSPNRINLKAFKTYTEENLNTLFQYSDWITKKKEITFGKTKLSAVCPHLGGIVRWNASEKTWDCPCHGSRFAPDGKVIQGPACSNLKKIGDN